MHGPRSAPGIESCMPLISLSIQHGQKMEEARARLEMAVREIQARFSTLVQRVQWAADYQSVTIIGTGFQVEMRIDAQSVHVAIDAPLLNGLLRAPFVTGLKSVLQKSFQKRLS